MSRHDYKYKQLKTSDNEENLRRDVKFIANPFSMHWTFKLLFAGYLLAQVWYLMYESEFLNFSGNNANTTIIQKLNQKYPEYGSTQGGSEDYFQSPSSYNNYYKNSSLKTNEDYNNPKTITIATSSSVESTKWTQSTAIQYISTQTPNKTAPTATFSNEAKEETQSQRKYFINTSRCRMPYVNPFTADILNIFDPRNTTGCTNDEPIITSHYDEVNREYILRTNYTVALQLDEEATAETVAEDLRCCYREIARSGSGGNADKQFTLLPCTNFPQNFVVPDHIKGVIINCTSKKTNRVMQQDAFSFVQVKQTDRGEPLPKRNVETTGRRNLGILLIGIDTISRINVRRVMPRTFKYITENGFYELKGYNKGVKDKRLKLLKNVETTGRRNLGILLIGIDTISRINVRRVMPRTFKYITENGFYELKGYNKVGENTLPNLVALLTGYEQHTAYNGNCHPSSSGFLDNCNFIWANMSDHGFVTAYAEDSTFMSTFNFNKKGFLKLPTDYYFRPMALALDRTLNSSNLAGLKYCIGRHQSGEYIYEYGVDFAKRFKNQSNFGLFWTNSFSHNAYDTAATMDIKMMQYFEDLEMNGIMETSVVVFFSDHGSRWGSLVKLPEGFLEQRLPMFFISLPKWFKQEYPDLLKNLEVNQQRLTTPYDIYMTLQHLLQLTSPTYKMMTAFDCAQAQSILQELPEDRTCEMACIPETWCTCIPYVTLSTKSDIVREVTQLILKEMNNYLAAKNMSSDCSVLTLKKISKAFLRDVDHADHSPSNIATYRIIFSTKPETKPVAEFGAIAEYDTKLRSISMNVEDISRQSMYEKTAQCTDDKQLKKYCICKSSLITLGRNP